MKSKAANRKVSLSFMDMKVSLEGNYKDIEIKAYAVMDVMIKTRMNMEKQTPSDIMFG